MATLRLIRTPAIAAAEGAAAGIVVAVVAFLLARYGPTGSGWSFRGNGALAAYALMPAFLAGGWTATVLRHQQRPPVAGAIAAALLGVGLAALDAALLPVFGPSADRSIGPVVLFLLIMWAVIAPVLALFVGRRSVSAIGTAATAATDAFLWAAGLVVGMVAIGFVLPPGS